MGEGVFGNLAPTRPRRENRPENLEPRLFAAGGSRASDPPASENVGVLSMPNGRRRRRPRRPRQPLPPTGSRSRPTGSRCGTLLYLVLIGLIATITVGAFFGGGLLLLAGRGKETVAASKPSSARLDAPRAERAPAALESAVAAFGSGACNRGLAARAASGRRSSAAAAARQGRAGFSAGVPAGRLGRRARGAKGPGAGSAIERRGRCNRSGRYGSPAAPIFPGGRRPAALDKADARDGHGDRAAKAARHSHLRSAHDNRPGAPRRSRSARSSTPAQAGQFNQLLTQLTGAASGSGGSTARG